jgi:hypothetical protein
MRLECKLEIGNEERPEKWNALDLFGVCAMLLVVLSDILWPHPSTLQKVISIAPVLAFPVSLWCKRRDNAEENLA